MVDTEAAGLACYCKDPEDSDPARERVIISTFAGCHAENRCRADLSFGALDELAVIWSLDWREARVMLLKMSDGYLANGGLNSVQMALETRSERAVKQSWHVITAVADALLAKEWEPIKPLRSGCQWSNQTMAKYLAGHEAAAILEQHAITATLTADC